MRDIWSHEWSKHFGNVRMWLVLVAVLILTVMSTVLQLRSDKYVTVAMSQAEYDEYRDTVIDDAKKRLSVSLFASDDSFLNKNAYKIIEKYSQCEGITVTADNPQGIRVLCDSLYENVLLVFWILFCINIVVYEEKKIGQYSLQRTTRYGRKHLGIIKLSVLSIMSIWGMALLILARLFTISIVVGLGDVHRSIQSVFPESTVHMTVLDVMVVGAILKLLAVVLLTAFLFWLSQIMKNGYSFIWIATGVLIVSIAVYIFVPSNSWISLLKELNIWSFLNSTIVFSRYKNLSFFSYPLDYRYCSLAVMLILLWVFSIPSMLLYGKNNTTALHISSDVHLLKGRHIFAFLHEGYKLIFIAGWWIIIIALVVGMYYLDDDYYKYDNLADYYELQYCNYFDESWNDSYERYLSDEIEKVGGIDIVESNPIGSPQIYALNNIYKKTEYVRTVDNGYVLYEKGYHKLIITQNIQLFVKQMTLIGILMLIAMGTIWQMEVKYDQIRLLRITKYGLKRVRRHKRIYALLLGLVIFIVTWSLPVFRVISTYGVLKLYAPAASLEILSGMGNTITIGMVLFLQFFVLLIVTEIFAVIMMKIMGLIFGGTDYE